jgi:XTP/dITP diphosphohydrolase
MRRLLIASRNSGKVAEIRRMLESEPGLGGWEIAGVPAGHPEPEETGETFEANAVLKALDYDRQARGWEIPFDPASTWTVADDSGLEVDALDGRPGVRSSRYAPTDPERIARLLGDLDGVPEGRRTARFVCAVALAHQGALVWTGRGEVEGRIATQPTGTKGFGYDPVFFLPELGQTMAELEPEAKNRTSHRGRALNQLVERLRAIEPGPPSTGAETSRPGML